MSETAPPAAALPPREEHAVTDSLGRKLAVIEMDPGDQLDLYEACDRHSSNPGWLGMALLVCSCTSIDGIPTPTPRNPDQVKSLARKLGKPGIEAIAIALKPRDADSADAITEMAKN